MADIAAGDVTYTLQPQTDFACPSDPRKSGVYKVEFGDGADTYPSGGVPLTKGKLGCPTIIEHLTIDDMNDANGLVYKYDYENEKLRIYQGDYSETTDGALVELAGGSAAPAATTLYLYVKGW